MMLGYPKGSVSTSVKKQSPLRILLVEDNEYDRMAIARALRKSQVPSGITECSEARAALDLIRADASLFDLLVVDHGLPGMSGLDLCRTLLNEEIPLPLVLLTGQGSEQLAVTALKLGVDDYIVKDPGHGYLDLLPFVLTSVVRSHGDRLARKLAEEKLRKTNEELKNFLDIVSHELKNPITLVQGFSSLLLERYQENLDETGQTFLERIQASSRRMENLVTDLLALAGIGRVVSMFDESPSLHIVKEVISGFQDRLEAKGIELVVADKLPSLYCDVDRMYQVFENLLGNAIKFTEEADSPRIEIGCESKKGFHRFFVKDNGIGIDPKYTQKIFEKFSRPGQKGNKVGTGLGLAIVERIVRHHGGRVWVESEPGMGSTFFFTIPMRDNPNVA